MLRRMQHLRSYICPFHELLPYVPRDSTVLDIGCGSGLFLGLLHRFGFDVTGFGFDASRVAIECADRMAQRHANGNLRFEYLDIHAVWPGGEFDVVSMLDVLHHIPVPRQEKAFRDAASAVRPGGLLLYKDMSETPWYCAAANRLHDLVVARQWIHYVPIATVDRWAEGLQLQTVAAQSIRMLWYQHDLRVFRRGPMP